MTESSDPAERQEDDRAEQQDAPREREFQQAREREQGFAPPGQARQRDEDVVRRETEAAAGEAARIGGTAGDESEDEAARASLEHGGGEAEGFEEAEQALVEEAEHGEGRDPAADEYLVDEEARRESAAHGEPDEIRSTEGVEELEAEDLERDPEDRESPGPG
jgi:hypothetical protein